MRCGGFLRDSPRLGLEGRNRNTTSELAEGVGFEPTVPCDTTVFETVRFVRSRIPPSGLSCSYSLLVLVFCPNSGTVQPWEHEVPMVQARCASARLVRVVGNSEITPANDRADRSHVGQAAHAAPGRRQAEEADLPSVA